MDIEICKGLFFLVLISAFQPPSLQLDVDSLRGIFYLSNPKVVPYRFFKSLIDFFTHGKLIEDTARGVAAIEGFRDDRRSVHGEEFSRGPRGGIH
jgi:hypothetical protein